MLRIVSTSAVTSMVAYDLELMLLAFITDECEVLCDGILGLAIPDLSIMFCLSSATSTGSTLYVATRFYHTEHAFGQFLAYASVNGFGLLQIHLY